MEVKISSDEERVKVILVDSVSIFFVTEFNKVPSKRSTKPNKKFLGSPWTLEGKCKRKMSDRSQIYRRAFYGGYMHVLALDPFASNDEVDATTFDAWYHKHLAIFKS